MKESDIGTKCGEFKVELIGDEYFTYLVKCENPQACTVLLRGASKDILNEIERNLHDAMAVTRNVMFEPSLSPGVVPPRWLCSVRLAEKAKDH